MTVRGTLVANYAAQGWAALMAIAVIPAYVRLLGLEAYALIGFFMGLGLWLTLLDLGMGPTLMRRAARGQKDVRSLLHGFELLAFVLAGLVMLTMALGAETMASGWFGQNGLARERMASAIMLMGLAAALRQPEMLYRATLVGLGQQQQLAAIVAGLATLRGPGAVAVLYVVDRSLTVFFLWQAVVGLLGLAIYRASIHSHLPAGPGRIGLTALCAEKGFTGSMALFSLLSILLLHADKLILPRLLDLGGYGLYMFAFSMAALIGLLSQPIQDISWPRFVRAHDAGDRVRLSHEFHRSATILAALSAPPLMLMLWFPVSIIHMWSGDEKLAQLAAALLPILALVTWLHTTSLLVEQVQIAAGRVTALLSGKAVGATFLIVGLFQFIEPDAALWAACLVAAALLLQQLFILPGGMALMAAGTWHRWLFGAVGRPLLAALIPVAAIRWILPEHQLDRVQSFVMLLVAGTLAVVAVVATSPLLRGEVRKFVKQ
ncbi:MAG: MATE family efflux transporter [Pacificimonas sp.]